MTRLTLLLLTWLCLGGCALPDRYNVGYSHELAGANNLPARDIVSVGVSGPLGDHHRTEEGNSLPEPGNTDAPTAFKAR